MTQQTGALEKLSAALADRYAIAREIGAGGMATVYLAEDMRHHRKVAIKVLHPDLSALLGSDRFLKEIELTANLQHPHILPLFDSGDAGGLLYYVMPYVEGESLRGRLEREQQLPVGDAVRIATEVADALEYAHKRGVVHRDIKPENILIHDGRPLVADFGIALAVQHAGGARMTQTGMSLGTPQYMAPEQAMGDKSVDHRADIYALGAVTYEMLSGEAPFIGPNSQAIIARLLTEAPRSLSRHRHTIPEHVERAVLTALEKLPADRFASAAQFGEALSDGKASRSPTAAAHATGARPWEGAVPWRNRTAAIASAAAVAGVALGWLIARSGGEADSVPMPSVEFLLDARLAVSGSYRRIAVAHDGSAVAYASVAEQNRSQLMIRRLDDAEVSVIPGTMGNIVQEPAFSPDGNKLAFYADQQLRVVDLQGGGARALARMSPTHGGLSWGGNGQIIFQRGFGRGLSVVHESSGEVRELTQVDTVSGHWDHRWPSILPDGRSAVFTIWRGLAETASIAVVSIETGEIRELLPGFYPRYSAGHLLFALPSGALQAVPFDIRRREIRGPARSILDSLPFEPALGNVGYDASPTGTIVVEVGTQSSVPVIVDFGGTTTDLGMPGDGYLSPRVSTRANAIAIGRRSRIWMRDLGVGTFGLISSGRGFYPLWSPDGKKVYYSRNAGSDVHVYAAASDRSTEDVPVVRARGQFRAQALSPDSRHLLIRVNAAGAGAAGASPDQRVASPASDTASVNHYDLWVVTLDSVLTPRPWLTTAYLERAPDFSPDGRWVAYSSDESGRDEIYVRSFPGPGGRTQLSSDGGTEPMWLRDGRGVIYRSDDEFLLAPVRTTPTLEIAGPPRTLFRGNFFAYPWSRQYDLHPDGRRLVALRPLTETSNVRVIVNWPGRDSAREVAPRPR